MTQITDTVIASTDNIEAQSTVVEQTIKTDIKQKTKAPEIKLSNFKSFLPKTRLVTVFNIQIMLDVKIKYVSIDGDGTIVGFTYKPFRDNSVKQWDYNNGDHIDIGKCTLKGDWTKTLVKL